jgi:hypothetical protein
MYIYEKKYYVHNIKKKNLKYQEIVYIPKNLSFNKFICIIIIVLLTQEIFDENLIF